MIDFIKGKRYSMIYADPPWTYRDKANAGKRGACHKYKVMTLNEICNLPVKDIAADDCVLAMWWVPPMPEIALQVLDSWGFKLKTMHGFVWHKLTKRGADHFGMGSMTRANCESCLIATRGKPKRVSASVRQFVEAPIQEHSAKPREVRDRLVQLLGDVPRIELFARTVSPGWDAIGDGVGGMDIKDSMILLAQGKHQQS